MTYTTHDSRGGDGLLARRSVLRAGAAAAATVLIAPARAKHTFPSRTVTIVVPSAAGGALDLIARRLAQHLGTLWGSSVVVDNKSGAVGTIGASAVVRARADAHTLLLGNVPLVQTPWLMKLPYDPIKDLTPLAKVAEAFSMLAVHKSHPANTLEEFIAQAKAAPGQTSYGSWGQGTSTHLWGLVLARQTNLDLLHVPYNGAAQVVNALLGRQISSAFVDPASSRANADSLKFLATLGTQRQADRPELPTFQEKGIQSLDQAGWVGLFAPAGIPAELMAPLSEALGQAVRSAEFVSSIQAIGMQPRAVMGDAFAAQIRQDAAFWGQVIRDFGVTLGS
jgi:tripartite-type tricarboxylate transporter receptor subunit TctC